MRHLLVLLLLAALCLLLSATPALAARRKLQQLSSAADAAAPAAPEADAAPPAAVVIDPSAAAPALPSDAAPADAPAAPADAAAAPSAPAAPADAPAAPADPAAPVDAVPADPAAPADIPLVDAPAPSDAAPTDAPADVPADAPANAPADAPAAADSAPADAAPADAPAVEASGEAAAAGGPAKPPQQGPNGDQYPQQQYPQGGAYACPSCSYPSQQAQQPYPRKCSDLSCPRTVSVTAVGTAAAVCDRVRVSLSMRQSAYARGYGVASAADTAQPLVESLARAARSLRSRAAAAAPPKPATASVHITSSLDPGSLKESLAELQEQVRGWLQQQLGVSAAGLGPVIVGAEVSPAAAAAPSVDDASAAVMDPAAAAAAPSAAAAAAEPISIVLPMPPSSASNASNSASAASTSRVRPSADELRGLLSSLQTDMGAASSRLRAYLASRTADVSGVEGGDLRISPSYDYGCYDSWGKYDGSKCDYSAPMLVGYDGWAALQLDVQLASSSEVVAQALQRGATSLEQISYKAGDDALYAAEQQATQQAAKLALGKASSGASALALLLQYDASYAPPAKLDFCSLVCAPVDEHSYAQPLPYYSGALAASADASSAAAAALPSAEVAAAMAPTNVKVKVKCSLTIKVADGEDDGKYGDKK